MSGMAGTYVCVIWFLTKDVKAVDVTEVERDQSPQTPL